jgi:hypothetical protein
MEALKLAQAQERRLDLELQLFDLVSRILDELEGCLLEFAAQAAEKIFKSYPDISAQFDRQRVTSFRREMQAVAREAVDRLIGFLADEALWIQETPSRRPKESLRQNLKVWEAIQNTPLALVPVLKRYGYPARSSVLLVPYRELELKEVEDLPHSESLKLLSIQYWLTLGKFQQTLLDSQRLQQSLAHQSLDDIWNS